MSTGSSHPERRVVITRQKHQGQYFTEWLDENTPLEMMLIPGGTFMMGQTEAEKTELIRLIGTKDYQHRYITELPRHLVTVQTFFLGKYPVTQSQWQVIAAYPLVDQNLNSDPFKFKGDNRPVESVSWNDATEFCRRLSQRTGRTYRLPSEAEWEYACRAGTETPFHCGETLSDDLVNYSSEDEMIDDTLYEGTYGRGILGLYRRETTPVGSFPANPFGLYDMHGNVWEWCEDDYHSSYEGAPTDGSAWIDRDRTETHGVLRGGSWSSTPRNCRSANRYGDVRGSDYDDIGFRVCCTLPIAQAHSL